MRKIIIIALFLILYPFTSFSLTENEYEEIKQQYPDFLIAEHYLNSSWSDIQNLKNSDPEKFKAIKKEQIEWIKNGRDIRAKQLMNNGLSKYQAYSEATAERASYLADISSGKNFPISQTTVNNGGDTLFQYDNLHTPSDKNDNKNITNLGLYGFSLNLSLGQALKLAQEKNYEISLTETSYNSKFINLLVQFLKSKDINTYIEKGSAYSGYSTLSKDDEISNSLRDALYGVHPPAQAIIDSVQINFLIENRCKITLSFCFNKDEKNINFDHIFPYSIFIHMFKKEYYQAALNIFEQRSDKKEEKLYLKFYIKGDSICEDDTNDSNYDFLIYSPTRINQIRKRIDEYYKIENENKKREEQDKLQQLQEGM